MVDVDGSYLWRKRLQLKESGVLAASSADVNVLPSPPPSGWVTISESTTKSLQRIYLQSHQVIKTIVLSH